MRIGIDLGGTKIEVVALDGEGREVVRRRQPTARGDYQATLDGMAAMVRSVEAELGTEGTVGIGHPGDKTRVTGHVLGDFAKADEEWLAPLLAAAATKAR